MGVVTSKNNIFKLGQKIVFEINYFKKLLDDGCFLEYFGNI